MAFWVKKCNTLLAVRQPMGQKKDLVIFFRAKKKILKKIFTPVFRKTGTKKKILKKENLKKKKTIRTVI